MKSDQPKVKEKPSSQEKSSAKPNRRSEKISKKDPKKPNKPSSGFDAWFCGKSVDKDECEDFPAGCGMWKNDPHEQDKLLEVDSRTESRCESPPNSSFTRMVSDTETVMQQTRQKVLGAKLNQIANNGPENMGMNYRLQRFGLLILCVYNFIFCALGGTLKIYGELIDPSVPYKTLLLPMKDTVSQVIRQALDKYGLEFADPSAYCLVMRTRYANETPAMDAHEDVLPEAACPLKILLGPGSPPKGIITTFEVRFD